MNNKIQIINGEHTCLNFEKLSLIDQLDPNKVYLLNYNSNYDYYYLTVTSSLELPKKVYGNKDHLDRFLRSYDNSPKSIGVLLTGIKGDGKSVDAKILALNSKQPIIVINSGYRDQQFLEFISNPLFNNTTIFIDEFEKLYSDKDSEDSSVNLLKLLDGYSNNKNLFVMTSNSTRISEFLLNRPSRIRYLKKYEGLSETEMLEIISDLLNNKSLIQDTLKYLSSLSIVTTDILIEIINEMNILDISVEKAFEDFNFQNLEKQYEIEITYQDVKTQINTQCYFEGSLTEFEDFDSYLRIPYEDSKKIKYTYCKVYPSEKLLTKIKSIQNNKVLNFDHDVYVEEIDSNITLKFSVKPASAHKYYAF